MNRTRAMLLFGALLLAASLAWGPATSTASDTAEPPEAGQIVLRPRGGHRQDTASALYRRHVPGAPADAVSSPAVNRAIQEGLAEEDTGQRPGFPRRGETVGLGGRPRRSHRQPRGVRDVDGRGGQAHGAGARTSGSPHPIVPGPGTVVGELIDRWHARQERADLSDRTVAHYDKAARHRVAWVREVGVHRLDHDTVERYRDHRLREGASPRLIVQELPACAPSRRTGCSGWSSIGCCARAWTRRRRRA